MKLNAKSFKKLMTDPEFAPEAPTQDVFERIAAAFDHCEHGNRKGDFCMGCEQERMG